MRLSLYLQLKLLLALVCSLLVMMGFIFISNSLDTIRVMMLFNDLSKITFSSSRAVRDELTSSFQETQVRQRQEQIRRSNFAGSLPAGTHYIDVPWTFEAFVASRQPHASIGKELVPPGHDMTPVDGEGWVRPTLAMVAEAAEVTSDHNLSYPYVLQFMDVRGNDGPTEEALTPFLQNTAFAGMEKRYMDLGNKYGINAVFMAAHINKESGNGTSTLSNGTAKWKGQTVYNVAGIGANDGNALAGGSAYAHQAGWISLDLAIEGAFEFIASNYSHNTNPLRQQYTWYNMRWNPLNPNSGGFNQYMSNIHAPRDTAANAADFISEDMLPSLRFEIPRFQD